LLNGTSALVMLVPRIAKLMAFNEKAIDLWTEIQQKVARKKVSK